MKTYNHYILCDTHIAFANVKEKVQVDAGCNMYPVVKNWAKEHGVKSVFVYTVGYKYVWSYDF